MSPPASEVPYGTLDAGRNLLRSFLFGTEPGDPRVFVGAALVLLVAGIVSTYVPARRAGRIEPADALRVE